MRNFTYLKLLLLSMILWMGGTAWADTETIYSETMGTPSGNTKIEDYSDWSNQDVVYTGDGTCDLRTTSASTITRYETASGGGNVMINNEIKWFKVAGINTQDYDNLKLSFGLRKGTTAEDGSNFKIEVSTNDEDYTQLTFDEPLPTGSGTANWYYVTISSGIPQTSTLYIKFSQTASVEFRLDDLLLTGEAAITAPTATVNPTTLDFATELNQPVMETFTVSASNITMDAVVFSISGTDMGMFTVTPNYAEATNGTVSETPITVTYRATEVGSHSAVLSVKDGGMGDALATIDLTGITTAATTVPTITVVETEITEFEATVGESATQTVTVSGADLTSDISISFAGDNASYFSASPFYLDSNYGSVIDPTAVTITYAPTEAGTHTATVTFGARDAEAKTFTLTGICTEESLGITSTTPTDGATGIPIVAGFIDIVFNEWIDAGILTKDDVTLKKQGDDTDIKTDSGIENKTYYIGYDALEYNSTYVLEIPVGVIDKYNETITLSFTTESEPLPLAIIGYTPTEGATGVAVDAEIKVQFNQEVQINPRNNFFVLINTDTGGAVEGINAESEEDYVVISHPELEYGTNYRVEIGRGSVIDYSEKIEWTFKTGANSLDNVFASLNLYANNGNVYFTTSEALDVKVYSVTGACMYRGVSTIGLNTISMNKGVYVITIGETINKIIVK